MYIIFDLVINDREEKNMERKLLNNFMILIYYINCIKYLNDYNIFIFY